MTPMALVTKQEVPNPQLAALAAKFKSIRGRVDLVKTRETLSKQTTFGALLLPNIDDIDNLRTILKVYGGARKQFQLLTANAMELDEVIFDTNPPWTQDQLKELFGMTEALLVNCDAATAYLHSIIAPIPKDVEDNLEGQRARITPLEDFDPKLYRHLSKAIDEHESGHYLAAAILAGKTTMYLIEKWPNKTSNEDIAKGLVEKGVLSQALQSSFVTGLRRARGYFTHDLASWPDISEALSMVSDSVDFAMRYWKAQADNNHD
jgi:hypothetical protein